MDACYDFISHAARQYASASRRGDVSGAESCPYGCPNRLLNAERFSFQAQRIAQQESRA